ncbi:Spectrin and I-set domain containing protein [Trichuris trichiura]|uniref:Spectrin and I-set domain containing protein n=1 Tax=Trichuris trichiura TaxID=36087 RepID=A0A077Z838_TRITR|nr:Spectrin and I-set domain containing protein [Trichuris trichiura]
MDNLHSTKPSSTEGEDAQPSSANQNPENHADHQKPSTTTISTIVIKAGDATRLVLAVLQSGDHVRLEVDSMVPPMLDVGQNYEEAITLQTQHLDLIARLQSKQANVEELLSNADSLVAEKSGTDSAVYEAMADSLGTAWKDLNQQIQIRAQLLEQAVEFFSWSRKVGHLRELLETLVDAMSYGDKVIEKMREIGRVVQNSERVRETFVACEKIEQEMIRINERAQNLRDLWDQKKSRLDWTIRVGHVYGKLKEIEQWVTDMKARLQNEDLGDSEMSAELLLNEVRKILDEAKVSIQLPNRFYQIRFCDALQVNEHSDVTLTCEVTGYPFPTIVWQKDSRPVSAVRCVATIQNRKCMLTIRNATCAETGDYSCIATNTAGSDVTKATVTVKAVPPKFVKTLTNGIADHGSGHVFNCTFFGMPSPSARWFKVKVDVGGDVLIFMQITLSLLSEWSFNRRLVLNNVAKSQAGIYTAVARNCCGEARCQATLQVNSRPQQLVQTTATVGAIEISFLKLCLVWIFLRRSTKILKLVRTSFKRENVCAPLGTKVTFECTVVGSPAPTVSWLFNKQPLVSSSWCQVSADRERHMLTIRDFKPEHVGLYDVVAENKYGTATSSGRLQEQGGTFLAFCQPTFRIWKFSVEEQRSIRRIQMADQRAPIEAAIEPPHFVQPLESRAVYEQEEVRFEGILTGTPEIRTVWLKDGQLIADGTHRVQFDKGKAILCIDKAEFRHAGRYSCRADNAAGTAISSAVLTVKAESTPPDFINHLVSQEICEGEQLCWEANVCGIPKPTVKWFRNGDEISSCPEFQIIDRGNGQHALLVPCVQLEDTGTYTLVAENCSGEARSTADLLVKKRDQLSRVSGCTTRVFEENVQVDMQTSTFHAGQMLFTSPTSSSSFGFSS